MGICRTTGRITINHRNIPNMLTQFTGVFAAAGINISDMINKSRGEYAYSMFDIESDSTEELKQKLEAIDGVLKVRIVK
jgi:D-3-phosphoglycerate dehydrogenase